MLVFMCSCLRRGKRSVARAVISEQREPCVIEASPKDEPRTNQGMSQVSQVYGGDEINAVVLEPGSAWTRAGWSAEDSPGISFSTNYAVRDSTPLYGDEYTYLVRPDTEIVNPMEDSVVKDWDAAKGLWKAALSEASPSRNVDYISECPLLLTEPFWNSADAQKRTMQFALEELDAPAMYIAKSPVLALFSAGRGTGIVVDVGAQTCSVTAVVDGFCLYKSARRSRRAGNYLSHQVKTKLEVAQSPIIASYEVKSKRRVNVGEQADFVRKPVPEGILPSFREYQVGRIVDLFKEQMVQVSDIPLTAEEPVKNVKPRSFEFPDGQQIELMTERYELGETLFSSQPDETLNQPVPPAQSSATNCKKSKKSNGSTSETNSDILAEVPQFNGFSHAGISSLIYECLTACDVDVRANLANNIVITGGTTLTQGFTERINQDVQKEFPMMKIRLFASGNMVERRNGAWIGGSILASLGTFHQMWITRQEFEEVGADQIVKKRIR